VPRPSFPNRAKRIANRPVNHDVEDDQGRNVGGRFFNRVKHWRGLASRDDKHAVEDRGGIDPAAIVDWLEQS